MGIHFPTRASVVVVVVRSAELGGWRNARRTVGEAAIKFYYQIKARSQENASLLGVPPKQYLQVLHLSKLRRRAAMNFPCIDLKLCSYISALM